MVNFKHFFFKFVKFEFSICAVTVKRDVCECSIFRLVACVSSCDNHTALTLL